MTGEEMERAIEFLLQSQANSEARQEKTDRQIAQTNQQLEQLKVVVEAVADTQTEFIQMMTQQVAVQGEINASIRQTMHELAESQQRTDQSMLVLAESQQRTDQSMLVLAESQQRTDQSMLALAKSQQKTQQEISDLTKAVSNLIKFSSGNGSSGQE